MRLGTERIRTIGEMRAFLDGSEGADFRLMDREEAYDFVSRTLVRFRYHHRLPRADKGLVREFLIRLTGLSRAQVARLIAQHRRTGGIRDHRSKPPARPFVRKYTPRDIVLLAEFDDAYGHLSGPATKEALRRQFEVHGDIRFERLAGISNGHIYNLRRTRTYCTGRLTHHGTRASRVSIGKRRRPRPEGRPGYLRVDTVHLGDRPDAKGIYVVNVVDEVTQYQHLGAVPRATFHYLGPLLESAILAFPFEIRGFHADNGSEFINHRVADLLNRLHIESFTKSRPRRSNDNALVESKNGSIVRKWLGHRYVPEHLAPRVSAFLQHHLSPFLNHHRPCLFPTERVSGSGRVRRRYRQQDVATPYERFKRLPDAETFLRSGLSLEVLDREALSASGLDAAKELRRQLDALLRAVHDADEPAA